MIGSQHIHDVRAPDEPIGQILALRLWLEASLEQSRGSQLGRRHVPPYIENGIHVAGRETAVHALLGLEYLDHKAADEHPCQVGKEVRHLFGQSPDCALLLIPRRDLDDAHRTPVRSRS